MNCQFWRPVIIWSPPILCKHMAMKQKKNVLLLICDSFMRELDEESMKKRTWPAFPMTPPDGLKTHRQDIWFVEIRSVCEQDSAKRRHDFCLFCEATLDNNMRRRDEYFVFEVKQLHTKKNLCFTHKTLIKWPCSMNSLPSRQAYASLSEISK